MPMLIHMFASLLLALAAYPAFAGEQDHGQRLENHFDRKGDRIENRLIAKIDEEILVNWNVELKRLRSDLPIAGSPERTEYRIVVEDQGGHLFVLEKIPTRKHRDKRAIIDLLNHLHAAGLAHVQPYLPDARGNQIIEHERCFWQLMPFIMGMALNRPDYVFDQWRGPRSHGRRCPVGVR